MSMLVAPEFPPAPSVPDEMIEPFKKANFAFPQMYGMLILRTGRVALDLMLAGELGVDDLSYGQLDKEQKEMLGAAAQIAHIRAGVEVDFSPCDQGIESIGDHGVNPFNISGVYLRTRNGIMEAIHGYASLVLPFSEDAPLGRKAEQRFMARKLIETSDENRPKAELLQTIWQHADEAVSGRRVAEATAKLHTALGNLPPFSQYNERRADIALATREARTTLNAVLVNGLRPLGKHTTKILGDPIASTDVITSFPLHVLYEGRDELTDQDIEDIRLGQFEL